MKGIVWSIPFSLLLWILIVAAIAKADFPTAKAKWIENGITYGKRFCAELDNTACSFDCRLNNIYYDGEKVFRKLYTETGDSAFLLCANRAQSIYKTYITQSGGALQVPGYRNFVEGFALAGEGSWVNDLATNAAYARYSPENLDDTSLSREVSYAIVSYVHAKRMGYPLSPYFNDRVNSAFNHLSAWVVDKNAPYVRPFMVALTAKALIDAEQSYPDARTLPMLQTAASWLWDNTWLAGQSAFKYTDRTVPSGGTEPAPDINLLIAPMYYWLYAKTGAVAWRDKGDAIFEGGVNQAYFASGKQFNQNYFWMFEGLAWRSSVTPTPTPVPTATPTRTPTPCSTARSLAAHDCRLKVLEKKL